MSYRVELIIRQWKDAPIDRALKVDLSFSSQ